MLQKQAGLTIGHWISVRRSTPSRERACVRAGLKNTTAVTWSARQASPRIASKLRASCNTCAAAPSVETSHAVLLDKGCQLRTAPTPGWGERTSSPFNGSRRGSRTGQLAIGSGHRPDSAAVSPAHSESRRSCRAKLDRNRRTLSKNGRSAVPGLSKGCLLGLNNGCAKSAMNFACSRAGRVRASCSSVLPSQRADLLWWV